MTSTLYKKNRYKHYYQQIIRPELLHKLNKKNIFDCPYIEKIVINCTSKLMIQEKNYSVPALLALEMISGQKAVVTKAKKAIAAFQIRQHQILGCKVTLRKEKMYAFLDKFNSIVLPRQRELKSFCEYNFDAHGNFNIGITNILLFPEVENNFEYFESIQGLTISIKIRSKNKKESFLLLSSFAFPL